VADPGDSVDISGVAVSEMGSSVGMSLVPSDDRPRGQSDRSVAPGPRQIGIRAPGKPRPVFHPILSASGTLHSPAFGW
jgi:hypothetical protein